jgi:CBS domain-containing protein
VNVSSQVDEVVMEMATRAASCAVVLRNDKLAGILTASDVCRLFGELLRETFPPEEDDEPA